MRSLVIFSVLVVLGGAGKTAVAQLSFADEVHGPTIDAAELSPVPDSVEESPQRTSSTDKTTDDPIQREIRELHEDVRGLRQDVKRLIELLEKPSTSAKSRNDSGGDEKSKSKRDDTSLGSNSELITDELLWEWIGLRVRESDFKSAQFRGGLEVIEVREASPAREIHKQDILVGLDKWEMRNRSNLDFVLRKHLGLKTATGLKFFIVRGGLTLQGEMMVPIAPEKTDPNDANMGTSATPLGQERWDLALREAVNIALSNSKAMRNLGVIVSGIDSTHTRLVSINKDISATSVAATTRNLVSDVEQLYWKLWVSHKNLESLRAARDSAQLRWHIAYEHSQGGINEDERLPREQYFFIRTAAECCLKELEEREQHLRFLLGLASSDNRFIRPVDQPPASQGTKVDWDKAKAGALSKSPEIIQQRDKVRQTAFKLEEVRKKLPEEIQSRLDGTFGDPSSLIMPVGFRRAMSEVRNLQLDLTRQKSRLEEVEVNTVILLSTAVRNLDSTSALSTTHQCRAKTAMDEVASLTDSYRRGVVTLDLLLDAQRRLVQAKQDYHASIFDQANALKEVEFRAGTLLEHRGITLADAPTELTY